MTKKLYVYDKEIYEKITEDFFTVTFQHTLTQKFVTARKRHLTDFQLGLAIGRSKVPVGIVEYPTTDKFKPKSIN